MLYSAVNCAIYNDLEIALLNLDHTLMVMKTDILELFTRVKEFRFIDMNHCGLFHKLSLGKGVV